MATEMIVAEGPPRNGMPSLHAAWAFLLWFGSRSLAARPRRSLRAFALLNLLATMGLRDAHWLTDLVVAMPLAVGARGACEAALAGPTRARVQALLGGAAQVVLWFVALWYGAAWFAVVPGAAWTAVGVTLVASLMLERRLGDRPRAAKPRVTGGRRCETTSARLPFASVPAGPPVKQARRCARPTARRRRATRRVPDS